MHGIAERTPTGGTRARTRRDRSASRSGRFAARGRLLRRILAVAAIAAFSATAGVVANPVAAVAADYPTWDELQAAKANTASAAKAVEQIKGLIAQLADNVEATRAEAEKRADELFVAQQEYDDAVRVADEIQSQADAAAAEAAEAEQNAGQIAAQLYRTGGTDLGVNLMLEAGDATAADEFLAKLGSMDKLVERTSGIYRQANEKSNAAQSLADQAEVARGERERLRIAAEEALAAAQAAQAAAEAALAESEAKKIELDQQLKFLQDTEAKTAAAYEEGERKRKEEEERRRRE
ncbi:M23 family peptidase, partial [Agromyces tardus]